MIEHLNNLKEPFSVGTTYGYKVNRKLCSAVLFPFHKVIKYYSLVTYQKILLPSSNGDIITSHLCHHHHVAICARLSGCA